MKTETYRDPVVEVYMRDVDRTLLRENLKLTFEQRALKHARALAMVEELRRAGKAMREKIADEPRSWAARQRRPTTIR